MSNRGNGGFLDVITNIATGGLVGYDGDKGFRAGGVLHALDEGLGEVTGRNLAREQANKAGEAAAVEDARRRTEMLNEQQQREAEDRAASGAAAGARRSSEARSRGSSLTAASMSDETDFLGL